MTESKTPEGEGNESRRGGPRGLDEILAQLLSRGVRRNGIVRVSKEALDDCSFIESTGDLLGALVYLRAIREVNPDRAMNLRVLATLHFETPDGKTDKMIIGIPEPLLLEALEQQAEIDIPRAAELMAAVYRGKPKAESESPAGG